MLTIKDRQRLVARSSGGFLALLFFLGCSASALGQNVSALQDVTKPAVNNAAAAARRPIASFYKEVKIGTTADEVRHLLGKARIDDEDGFFYEMDSEMVQIRLDADAKVRLISVTYANNSPHEPKYYDIFGEEPTTAKPDGSVYRLVRYPEAGYWIAYSKTSGDEPTVTVTMQKL